MRIRNLVAGVLALASSCMFAVAELVPHYAKAYKISATGGFVDEGLTSKSGLYAGDEVGAYIDWSKLHDKNDNQLNAFAKWTYTPATADLGAGFDPFNPEVTVTMPNADVKLTANYVNGFAAYVCAEEYETQGEAEPGDFYWSIDNGKTLIPFDPDYRYPVKAGKVTVKFYDKTGNWRAAWDDTFTVEKRGTFKEGGITYYDEPNYWYAYAKFVPVNNSTKVKFDVNGGTGPWEEYFANGYEFGELAIPYRKGYIFAGWWTDKTGGEHITASTVFDPALFAGQKTPTLYAHWLQLKKLTLKDDSAYAEWYLNEEDFDPELYPEIMHSIFLTNPALENGGYLEGKGVMEVLPGARVTISAESSLWDEKKDIELVFQKWTVTPANSDFGPRFQVSRYSTELTMPSADVTLQATYVDESTCALVFVEASANPISLGLYDDVTGEYTYTEPPYAAFEWSPDGGKTWYKVGYFNDEDVWMYDASSGWYSWGSEFLLKKGTYTITWRSTDPQWTTTDNGEKITIDPYYPQACVYATFSYVPQVVVDVMTFEDGECTLSPVGGTVTMNPKEGLVPVDKTITFTAKANKNYFFQGYALRKYWEYGDEFESTAATWKPDGHYARTYYDPYSDAYYECTQYLFDYNLSNIIDPNDLKVHVVAVFKALSAYSADDIKFVDWDDYEEEYVEIDSKDLYARTYCSVKYQVECGPMAFPLTYKLGGKLPAGLKFDAKTGVISGVPTKAGDATVTVTATDPAKNSKTLTVNISVKPAAAWMFGDYRGLTYAGPMGYQNQMTSVKPNGLLELSVSATGKGTAKLITRAGTRSASGQLAWEPDEYDPEGEGLYWFETSETKDEEELYVDIYPDGSIEGYADSYLKSEDDWIGGHVYGMRQDKELFAQTGFINQYYTAYLYAPTQNDPGYYDDDDYYYDDYYYYYDECSSGTGIGSGFGYLTVKTDAKGGAKITGKLPDGEAVTLSALVLPIDAETARMYVFSSPSAYKKLGWFAASLTLMSDGSIISEQGIFTRPYDDGTGRTEENPAEVYGALYSAAQTLEDYYFTVSCQATEAVYMQYTYREDGESWADYVGAITFGDDLLFNVNLKGDKNGGITLAEKSPAPWNAGGEWNYWEDKNGNPITDPSQLSISFTKATGLFSGKATLYFDYYDGQRQQHKTASLPYSGVVIKNAEEEGLLDGYGAAIYKAARTDLPCNDWGREKKYTQTVSLPVILVTGCGNCEEIGD